MTVLGTRPEIIRLCLVIEKLDRYCEHVLIHTGQNYDSRLNDVFFRELGLRAPDEVLGVRGDSPGKIMAEVIAKCEDALMRHRPDRLLILGDTYSGLAAVVARRMGIPVYHMEAGSRCFDFRVPEEINRRVIDSVSSVLMPYTERSRENLLREGFSAQQVYVTGNPIKEVLDRFAEPIDASDVLRRMGLAKERYMLLTLHRAENVDDATRLTAIFSGVDQAAQQFAMQVVCSVHPRTRQRLQEAGTQLHAKRFLLSEPFGFFDFVHLEKNAFCVLSDSGTVQEEACIFGVPNVTLRDVTERPETVECGSNALSGADVDKLLTLIRLATEQPAQWNVTPEYLVPNASDTVARIVLGHRAGTGC
ncbi:MAG TPA: UDP-N-acetylglucosamine 2-epimerase (non-hydrolyzing) [Terriglobales bacterium]